MDEKIVKTPNKIETSTAKNESQKTKVFVLPPEVLEGLLLKHKITKRKFTKNNSIKNIKNELNFNHNAH